MTNAKLTKEQLRDATRKLAEKDIVKFVEIVRPELYLGKIHKEILHMLVDDEEFLYHLVMIPRGHLKSQMMALLCAYLITIKPDITILYNSENKDVTEGQLTMIKNTLDSPRYRMYWPEMVNEKKSQRAKWKKMEFTVDHPTRKNNLSVREPTVMGRTVGQSFTGAHVDVAICDDLVSKDNAYTQAGRETVKNYFAGLMSIISSGAKLYMAGTPYHPADLYSVVEDMEYEDNFGNVKKMFNIRKEVVEKDGEFLWPRGLAPDGHYYGFDKQELSIKKAGYKENILYFFSQYYMNPQALDGERIGHNNFKYYEELDVDSSSTGTYINGEELRVTAAMDFAFSLRKSADSSTIVVSGMDADRNIYVLDIIEFKTIKIHEMYNQLIKAYRKWGFKKIRCETVAAQEAVVEQLIDTLKEKKITGLKVIKYKPNRHDGNKEERMSAQLDPVYQAGKVFHNKRHRLNSKMESELVSINPPHDDIKNALADSLMDLAPPFNRFGSDSPVLHEHTMNSHRKFGGYN